MNFNPIAWAKKQGLRGIWIPTFLLGLVILPVSVIYFLVKTIEFIFRGGNLQAGLSMIIFITGLPLILIMVSIRQISDYFEELFHVPQEMRFANPQGVRPVHRVFVGIWMIFIFLSGILVFLNPITQIRSPEDTMGLYFLGLISICGIIYFAKFIWNTFSDFHSKGQQVESEVVKVRGFGIPPWTTYRMKLKNGMTFTVPDMIFAPHGLLDQLQPGTPVSVWFTPHTKLVKEIKLNKQIKQ